MKNRICCILFLTCFEQVIFSQEWNALGPGLKDPIWCPLVNDILIDGDDLYAAGSFTDAGGNPDADYIARWDGHTWQPIGTPLNGDVFYIAKDSHNLFIAGYFTDAGGNPDADFIARWDGQKWNDLGVAIKFNPLFFALAKTDLDLYVGGGFTDFGGNPDIDYIARWDGTNWYPVGGGLNNWVTSIEVSGEDIYVGGHFTNADGMAEADHIVRWHERAWYTFPKIPRNIYGAEPDVYDITVLNEDEIYIAASYRFLKWDGQEWIVIIPKTSFARAVAADSLYIYLGSLHGIHRYERATGKLDTFPGIHGFVYDLETAGTEFYSAGQFYNAGGNTKADCIARWGKPGNELVIGGIPNMVCRGDPPFGLPVMNQRITGSWSGPAVSHNIFYPEQVRDLITITFTPDPGQAYSKATTTDIYVFDIDSIGPTYRLPRSICANHFPLTSDLTWTCPSGIYGRWSGPFMKEGYFDPAMHNGSASLTYTPEFNIDFNTNHYAIDIGQCINPPVWKFDVVNFTGVIPDVGCDDNGTPEDNDDFITIQIAPIGTYFDTVYEAEVSSGVITPSKGNYNVSSYFNLQPGSAGGGDVVLTLQDPDALYYCPYDVEIIDPGPCSMRSAEKGPKQIPQALKVFPNPTSDKVKYTFRDGGVQPHTVMLMDPAGRVLLTHESISGEIDLSIIPPGIYLLKIEARGKCEIVKVLKI